MVKKYKLLKDLPTFKAGEEFFISDSGNLIAGTPSNPKQITVETRYGLPMKIDLMAYAKETLEEFPNILKDWFEEIKDSEWIYCIDNFGNKVVKMKVNHILEIRKNLKSIGNYFETREEAEKHLEYLKAKTVIKQDTKGFKPDWNDKDETKYWGYWDFYHNKLDYDWDYGAKRVGILFKTIKDIEESFKKHPEEWRTYLTYEQ